MFKLKRLQDKPVLSPDERHDWEKAAVFNAAVIYDNNLFHMFYRASDSPFFLDTEKPDPERKFTSVLGYASSTDGIHFKRYDEPVLRPSGLNDSWGIEDPRLTKIDDTYYLLYTSFGGRDWNDIRVTMVSSPDLKQWSEPVVLLPDEPNKNAALLPEKINGKYVLFHRRHPSIWTAVSDDLIHWTDHTEIMAPRKGKWDSKKIGIAGPPLKIKDGWLMIYHGVDENNTYRLGAALLDEHNINRIKARQDEPILEPELDWEVKGLIPNVVFSCGECIVNNHLYIYYGAADTHIGVAGIPVDSIIF